MSIEIECPTCNQCYESPDRHAGKEIHCPSCGGAIQVPALPTGKEFQTPDEVLDFAIRSEETAAATYALLAQQVGDESMREILESLSFDELQHKVKLLKIKESREMQGPIGKLKGMPVGDAEDLPFDLPFQLTTPQIDYKKALIMAIKAEKASFKLYTDLAATALTPKLRSILLALAEEESQHALKLAREIKENFGT